jgi:hypothetical protein
MTSLPQERIDTVKATAGKLKCISEALERFAACELTAGGTTNCAERLAADIVACFTH